MLGSKHQLAGMNSDFYRDQFRRILRWLMVAISVIFIQIVVIIYFVFYLPPQLYYANTTEGKILSMPASVEG